MANKLAGQRAKFSKARAIFYSTSDDAQRHQQLREPSILEYKDDPEMSEYLVSVQWKKTFPKSEAKWQDGLFATPHIVRKM
jgi:hypothetical protein